MRAGLQTPIRIGVIGTGRIAKRFVSISNKMDTICITCVYNPHQKSAEIFAFEQGIAVFTDQWNVFVGMIDAAYIASPHETHALYSKALLEEGKHVLCEKPLCLKEREARDLYSLAATQKCILREAIKTAYCPGFSAMMELVQSGRIGKLCDVEACFTKLTPKYLREMTDRLYGGSVTELGSYVLLPIWRLLGTQFNDIICQSLYAENGVDIYTKLNFIFDEGMATAKVGLGAKSEGQLVIAGTKGYVLCESPWWMTRKFQVRYEDPDIKEEYEYLYEGSGLQYEIESFIKTIYEDDPNVYVGVLPQESIATAKVMEYFLNQNEEKRSVSAR